MAMGAHPSDILKMILGQGMSMVGAGAFVGLAGAAGLIGSVSRWLLIIKTNEPLTFLAVTFVLGVIALLACYIPARRAMKVDPMVVLRHE